MKSGFGLGFFFRREGGGGALILGTCVFVSKKRIFSGLRREGGEATVPLHVVLCVWPRALFPSTNGRVLLSLRALPGRRKSNAQIAKYKICCGCSPSAVTDG